VPLGALPVYGINYHDLAKYQQLPYDQQLQHLHRYSIRYGNPQYLEAMRVVDHILREVPIA